jgi:hypothetical protein
VKRVVVPLLVAAVAVGVAPSAATPPDPLEEVRHAMAKATFTGRVVVSWADGATLRHTSVVVRADHGDIELDGPVPIVKTIGSHFVRMSGGWSDLAPGEQAAQPATDKYSVRRGEGPLVAGRPTASLEILERGELRERLALDRELGVVLRREQLDDRGQLVRRVEFATFDPEPTAKHHGPPKRFRSEHPSTMGAAVPAPFRAPAALEGGYERVGVYRRGAVVQVVYGDGVYGLSVFEQPGQLDWDALPAAGRPAIVDGHPARSYVWPGGGLITWEAGGSTFTVIGDGLPSAVLAAAASMRTARALSTLQRVRQTARELVETLSGRA